jgi:hypothetical protein
MELLLALIVTTVLKGFSPVSLALRKALKVYLHRLAEVPLAAHALPQAVLLVEDSDCKCIALAIIETGRQ